MQLPPGFKTGTSPVRLHFTRLKSEQSELNHGDTCPLLCCAGVPLMLPDVAQVVPALAESWTCVGPGLTLQLTLFMCWSSCRERCLLPLQMALESKNTKLGQTALTGMQVDQRDDSILWVLNDFSIIYNLLFYPPSAFYSIRSCCVRTGSWVRRQSSWTSSCSARCWRPSG